MILGLTGGYCAGKNEVAAILAKDGWACIDVDRLGHEAVDEARDAIVRRFGSSVLGPDGRIDRKAVARIVFSDPSALADQEAIIHPIAIRLMDERVAAARAEARAAGREPKICLNAALLHRSKAVPSCDAILEVRAPLVCRIARGARRDGTSWSAAFRRIARQKGFRAALRAASSATGRPIIAVRNAGGRGRLGTAVQRALSRLGRA